MPPTTMMTGTTVQATLDAVDLLTGAEPAQAAIVRARFGRLVLTLVTIQLRLARAAAMAPRWFSSWRRSGRRVTISAVNAWRRYCPH